MQSLNFVQGSVSVETFATYLTTIFDKDLRSSLNIISISRHRLTDIRCTLRSFQRISERSEMQDFHDKL